MQQGIAHDPFSAARQLRPVVITVVAAKLAVLALLLTTINLQSPVPSAIELAEIR